MKHRVRITGKALRDVEEALRWFDEHQATAAGTRWLAQLMAAIDTLEKRPGRCPRAAEADEVGVELRELHYGKRRNVYRILFTVHGQVVNIVRVRHAARDAITRDDL